jgi:hypothetical protein
MLLAMVGTSKAQTNAFTVGDINLPQNSEATLTVSFQFDAADTYTAYSFNLQLPAELEFVMDTSEGAEPTDVAYIKGECHTASHTITANLSEGMVKVGVLSGGSKTLKGTSGDLLTFTIKPKTSSLQVGKTYTGTISDIILVPVEGAKQNLAASNFTVTIGEPLDFRTVLDENSTTPPTAATGVDVRVKRTINAGNWSTICLPFAMTGDQVKAAFGNDVAIADFKGYDSESDITKEGDDIVSMSIHFDNVSPNEGLLANKPYIIKVSSDITDFTVDNVDINPDEDNAYIESNNGRSGNRKVVYYGFYGTYKAETTVEELYLFLNSNKFYYSNGSTKMKAYRAYFYFDDVLTAVDDKGASARVFLSIDGESTKIDARTMEPIETGKVYNIAGQYVGEGEDMNRLPKGIYIVNGKKVIK